MDLERFRRLPLLGILRGIDSASLPALIEAAAEAGLGALEVTMNTADAPALIRQAAGLARGRMAIGAGTVLDLSDLERARAAGATFIVSPVLVTDVVARCVRDRVPVFPGALTPQEIFVAWKAGATMVKVFPASAFGPSYLREVKAPFGNVELLACGGVKAGNMAEYFAAGASAAAFGASVFRPEWLAAGSYGRIADEIRALVQACESIIAGRI
jgi:2-dehydro-3-deoxyphosphogluconate aldolase/(4S)-4-hydroxy-2-oxoglutarate aldolase